MNLKTKDCSACYGSGKMLDSIEVGKQLRQLREENGISLTEMASALNFSCAYICDLELGKRLWRKDLVDSYILAVKRCKS